jgi:hypothetical protein
MRCFAGAAVAGGLCGACAVELWAGGGGTIAKSIKPRTIIPRIVMITMFQCRKLTTLFVRSPCSAGTKYQVCGSDSREEYLRSYMHCSLPGAGSNDQSGTHPTQFMRRVVLRYRCRNRWHRVGAGNIQMGRTKHGAEVMPLQGCANLQHLPPTDRPVRAPSFPAGILRDG